jgi:WD40 repeat protein
VRCVSIDFSGIGSTSVTIDEWYYSIADDIAQALGLPNLDLFWTTHQHLTPVHRWYRFIRNELLDQVAGPIVVFIDEVDSVLALSFVTDDFFASIRSAYNLRADDPEYGRLTFCLLGVAAPADLIQNSVRTPFNIGKEIRLDDFSRAELGALLPGLDGLGCDPVVLLDAVYAWTSGHPYMTQRLCDDLTSHGPIEPGQESARVDDAAYNLFVRSGRGGDANLAYAEKRLDANQSRMRVRQILHLYRRLLDGERVPAEPNSQNQTELRLTGLAAEHLGAGGEIHLRTRNLIFAEVYDHKWLKTKEKEQRLAELVDRWVTANKIDDYLLRGAALEDALSWSAGRADLTVVDHEFLLAGVNYARREAEARHRVEEAARKEEAMRRTALEEQRKADRERYRADIERERRERAVEEALSQRRTISILTGTVATLGILLALFVWQYIVAENSKTQLAELNARAREDADLKQKGAEALLLAQQAGKEREALREAIRAAGSSRQKGRPVPSRVMQGLAAAVATPVQRPVVLRHSEPITVAEFSHDSTAVLTASRDHSVHLWDAVSGRTIRNLVEGGAVLERQLLARQHPHLHRQRRPRRPPVERLVRRPARELQGPRRRPAAAVRRRRRPVRHPRPARLRRPQLRLTDLRSPRVIETLRGHTGLVTAAAFSSDGLALLTACSDGSARLWSAEDGKLRATMRRHTGALRSVAFSPSGTRIITIGEDDTPRLWNEVGAHIAGLTGHTGEVAGAVFAPGQRRRRHLRRRPQRPAVDHPDRPRARQLHRPHRGDPRRSVRAGRPPRRHRQRRQQRQGLADRRRRGRRPHRPHRPRAHGPVLARQLARADRERRHHRPPVEQHQRQHRRHARGPHRAGVGRQVLARRHPRHHDRRRQHRPPVGRLAEQRDPHAQGPRRAGPGRPLLARRPAHRHRQRRQDGAPVGHHQLPDGPHPRGPHRPGVLRRVRGRRLRRLLTLAEDDAAVRLWDSATGEPRIVARHAGPVLAANFSRDGRRLLTAGADDTLRQWDVISGKPIGEACQGMLGKVDTAAISTGGAYTLTANRDSNKATLTADGCVVIADLVGHSGPVTGAAFSPDETLVATISTDNTTKLWSSRYGTDLDTLDTGSGSVHSVSFSRDGRLVVATARDAWVYAVGDGRGHPPELVVPVPLTSPVVGTSPDRGSGSTPRASSRSPPCCSRSSSAPP